MRNGLFNVGLVNNCMQPETTQSEPQWKRLKKLNLVGGKFAYLARVNGIDRAVAKIFLPILPPSVTPNAITVFRFISIPVIAYLLLTDFWTAGTVLFVISAFSDALDGALARTTNQISKWGIIADPVADKLLITTVAVIAVVKFLGWPLAVVIILLEVLLVLSAYFRYRGKLMPAKSMGKLKMILQCFGVGLVLLYGIYPSPLVLILAQFILYGAILFALLSLLVYRSI